jgi:hypothetical protein
VTGIDLANPRFKEKIRRLRFDAERPAGIPRPARQMLTAPGIVDVDKHRPAPSTPSQI